MVFGFSVFNSIYNLLGTTQYDRLKGTFDISVIRPRSFPYYSLIIPYVSDRSGQSSDKNSDSNSNDAELSEILDYFRIAKYYK